MQVSLKAVSGSISTVALFCSVALWSVALYCAQTATVSSSEPPPTDSQAKQATGSAAPVTPSAGETAVQGESAPNAPSNANAPGTISQTPAQTNPAPATAPPASASQQPPPTSAPPQLPPTRKPGTEPKTAADTKAGVGKPGTAAERYVIGPLDVLIIKVWGQANLSGPVDVTPDGTISLPLIGDVKADGLTKEQLKEAVATKLGDFLNSPEVDVQVARINSKRFFVYGGVGHQGEFPLVRPTTVMDAMSSVGGFRDFANTKKIRIQRVLPDGTIKEFKFNYRDVSKGKNMEQNILLQNGDRIFVPE
jgi:polysaccharide biosynthesis/export protein